MFPVDHSFGHRWSVGGAIAAMTQMGHFYLMTTLQGESFPARFSVFPPWKITPSLGKASTDSTAH